MASAVRLQYFSDPSPILLRSFSDPSPILLQPFSNPSPIPPNPPQVLLHPCKTQKRPNTEAQGVENFRYQSTNVFKIFLSDKEGRKEGRRERRKEGREGGGAEVKVGLNSNRIISDLFFFFFSYRIRMLAVVVVRGKPVGLACNCQPHGCTNLPATAEHKPPRNRGAYTSMHARLHELLRNRRGIK